MCSLGRNSAVVINSFQMMRNNFRLSIKLQATEMSCQMHVGRNLATFIGANGYYR